MKLLVCFVCFLVFQTLMASAKGSTNSTKFSKSYHRRRPANKTVTSINSDTESELSYKDVNGLELDSVDDQDVTNKGYYYYATSIDPEKYRSGSDMWKPYTLDGLRPAREIFSARASGTSGSHSRNLMSPSSSQVGFTDSSIDYLAESSGHYGGGHGGHGGGGYGHGHHGHGGGHGHGWGWGGWGHGHGHGGGTHTTHYVSSGVDSSSLGLLGLLGLLSLLSNVLLMLNNTTAAGAAGRRKRDLEASMYRNGGETAKNILTTSRLVQLMLPSLNTVGHATDGKLPSNCAHHAVCKVNQILRNELGLPGYYVGSIMSSAIIDMLKTSPHVGKRGEKFDNQQPSMSLAQTLAKAGLDGRTGRFCNKMYPTCYHNHLAMLTPQHLSLFTNLS